MTSDQPTKNDRTEHRGNPYAAPKLVEYGNIREITKALGGVVGKNDGGSGKDKTG
ncbi:MAG TPA: lasso RiPP family leader peptide-containing protein [Pyrinomonadaceae bacterium]|nr:lasso RiPP family leader peptide-containing protein [Pyrinomonadaceae bacterium]